MNPLTVTRQIFRTAIDFCFPTACTACNEPCEGASPLCAKCDALLDHLSTAPQCDQCASPLAYALAPCPRCNGEGPKGLDQLVALGVYEAPLSNLIQSIKYRSAWEWAGPLTDRLLAERQPKLPSPDKTLVVPIPLHPLRKFTRGFNQAELIATRLHRSLQVPWAMPLLRVRRTETQTHMPSAARREANVEGAFALDAARSVRGKHVILIDDVSTTGATLRAAATALRPARPASISAWVLAVADPKHRAFSRV